MSTIRYVEFEKLPSGNLKIILTPAGRQFMDEDEYLYPEYSEFFEYQLCNGWDEVLPDEIGALTSAPIFTDDIERDERGIITRLGTIYWYKRYQVSDMMEQLDIWGWVVLKGVGA